MMNSFENECDVILSTRVRFARNLKNYPFPNKLSDRGRQEVNKIIKNAILDGNSAIAHNFEYHDMSSLSEIEKISLVEKHLISPNFADSDQPEGLLLLTQKSTNKKLSVSIMLCEEDHIRLQVFGSGLDFEDTFDMAKKIDALLAEQLPLAFSERFGYLTQCPTNLGTGMRVSLMMHLPAIAKNGLLNHLQSDIVKLGFTIRGTYGEGTTAKACLYQLSNQISLGISEEDAIDNLKSIAMQIVDRERKLRTELVRDLKVQDTIARSLGILTSAKLLTGDECLQLLSNVRLGVSTGMFDDMNIKVIDEIFKNISPATLMKNAGKTLTAIERDQQRAILVKKLLNGYSIS